MTDLTHTSDRRPRNGRPQATSAEVLRELLEALPPHSLEAEMSLLGSLILDPRMVAEVLSILPGPDLFYKEGHAAIYKAILALYDQHEGWDAIQLLELLRDQGQLEQAGGVAYLKQLAECVPSAVNAPHYARLVSAKHRLRALIDSSWRIIYDAHNVGQLGPDGVAALLDRAEAEIFEIAHEKNMRDVESIAKILQDEIDRLEAQEGKGLTGVPTGYPDLDRMLSGLQPGEMLILAARPSMGKCLAADSEIVLDDGSVVTIEEIVRRRAGVVPTLGPDYKLGSASPSAYIDDGLKPAFEVTTRLGRRVVTTLTHPFLTIDGWMPLAEIGEGEHIAVPRALGVFGSEEMRACEVKLLAYLIGDGGLTGTNPRFTSANPEIAADFAEAVAAFGGLALRLSSTRRGEAPSWRVSAELAEIRDSRAEFGKRLAGVMAERDLTGRAVARHVGVSPATVSHWVHGRTAPDARAALRLCEFLEVEPERLFQGRPDRVRRNQPNALTRWLAGLGLMGAHSGAKAVPAPVFRLRSELLAIFLNRLFATDGWTTVLRSGQAQLGYSTVSERLARQVQHLLLRFGVIASLRQRWVKYRESRRVAWQLDITDSRSIATFAREIGIFAKEEKLDAVVRAVSQRRYQTNRDLVPVGVWDRIACAKGDRSWREIARKAGISSDNLHVGQRSPTRDRLGALARALGDAELGALAESDVYWDQIVAIRPVGETRVYDLTIPGTHNFVANDVCVHNTALALNLAEQVAFGGATPWSPAIGKPAATAIFSLEMSRGSLAQRLISARSGIDLHHLRTGQMGMDEWARLNAACGELHEAPLYIDDTPALTILQLRARARRMVSQFGVRVIIIDYLQLLTAPNASRESRQVEVATISRGIKALARELNVPVVCLAQLNRGTEQREGNRPRMADLRESGSIEQDADVVMLLHREAYYHRGDPEWLADPENEGKENLAELIIAKQRNGPTGIVNLTWDSKTTRFKSHDPHHREDFAGATSGGFNDYGTPSQAAGAPPAVRTRPVEGEYRGFAPGQKAGPVADFRDGGGPSGGVEEDEADDVPF